MRRIALVCMLALATVACGGGSDGGVTPTGAARSGLEIFEERILGSNAGCITCHSLDADTTLVGPSIVGVASRAAIRVAGVSADEYLRKSITAPSAFVVDGFDDGKMPTDWAAVLTAAEIDALVAYLLTLG